MFLIAVLLGVPTAGVANGPASTRSTGTDYLEVKLTEIEELRPVFATVRSRDRVEARVRIAGTLAQLQAVEGRTVIAGERLGVVADQKIALRLTALEAQIAGARSRLATARAELERASELVKRGVVAQARLDQLKAAHDSAETDLRTAQSEHAVALRTIEDGVILAPADGQILRVPVTAGTVVLPGESIATIAANAFLLRLEVPERHARFVGIGSTVQLTGEAGDRASDIGGVARIVRIYPEIQNGRLVADAEGRGLSSRAVGERVLVSIAAGRRAAIVVPKRFVITRFGFDYVRLARGSQSPIDIVVQLGGRVPMASGDEGVEILSGLSDGDKMQAP
jgi:RND family efflux transporter MFP subunit